MTLDRLKATVEALATNRTNLTATDPANPFSTVRNAQTILPINPWKMRAHMSATQSLNGNGEPATIVNLDTVDYDSSSRFNVTTHQYTVPLAGYWFIAGKVNINIGASAWNWLSWVARVYVNGNRLSEGVTVSTGDFTGVAGGKVFEGGYDAMVTDLVYLNAGDVVDLRAAMVNSASASATIENNLFTYLTMHLVSG